ncbi:MAG: hypothetical protein AB7N71_12795, partial [Phycisphaerae bacterium]
MKKLGIAFLVLIAVGAGSAFWLYRYIGAAGSSELEQWVARQVVGILEAYITPKITFDAIDYQAPRTVVIDDLNIVADEGTPMVALQQILLELAETPSRGKPIKIARIEIKAPDLNFIARDGALVGWGNFVKQQAVTEPETVPDDRKLSEVFELRHLSVTDAKITFDDPRLGDDKMVLTDITFSLDTPPADNESNAHILDFVLQRKPLIDVKLKGKINLDTSLLELAPLTADIQLEEDTLQSLPPNVQEMLRKYEIDGTLHANVSGEIPLQSPQDSSVSADVRMAGLGLDLFGFRGTLGELKIVGDYPAGPLTMNLANLALSQDEVKFLALQAIDIALDKLGNDANDEFHFDKVNVDGPEIRLVRADENRIIGWSELADFVSTGKKPATSQPATEAQQPMPKITFDEAALTNGLIEFRESSSADPLVVKWNTTIKPQQDQSAYDFAADLEATGMNLSARGVLEQSANRLQVRDSKLSINIDAVWPLVDAIADAAQQFGMNGLSTSDLQKYKPSGAISGEFAGEIPLDTPLNTRGNLKLNVADANFATDAFAGTTKRLALQASLPKGPATIEADDVVLTSERNRFFSVAGTKANISTFDLASPAATIENVQVRNADILLIANGPDSYVGWTKLANPAGAAQPAPAPRRPSSPQPAAPPSPFTVRQATFEGCRVAVKSSKDRDFTKLSVEGTVRTAQQPDTYDFNANLGSNGIGIEMNGFVDARNSRMRLDKSRIRMNLERARPFIAEAMQLAKIQQDSAPDFSRMEGELDISANGDFSSQQIANASVNLTLRKAMIPVGDYVLPIAALDAQGRSQNGRLNADIRGQTLDGSINAKVEGQSSGAKNFSGQWTITDVKLEEALKVAKQSAIPMAGKFSSSGRVQGAWGQVPQSLNGEGSLQVRQGHLVKLPVIADLLVLIEKTRLLPKGVATDTADAKFQINGNGVRILSSEVVTSIAA